MAIGPLGGIVGPRPIVGGTLLGPMKRELALAVRCELELVSGLPPSQTWSLNLQLSPFATGVRDGELVPDRHPDQLSRYGEVLDAVRGT